MLFAVFEVEWLFREASKAMLGNRKGCLIYEQTDCLARQIGVSEDSQQARPR